MGGLLGGKGSGESRGDLPDALARDDSEHIVVSTTAKMMKNLKV